MSGGLEIVFEGPAVMVSDVELCREFYEGVLGQEVLFSVGQAFVQYKSKFSLWDRKGAHQTVFAKKPGPKKDDGGEHFELYFETGELDLSWDKVRATGAPIVHDIQEQPWGQRCFRVLDPERNLVELGEPMPLVVARFLSQGLGVEETAKKSFMPVEMVEEIRKSMT